MNSALARRGTAVLHRLSLHGPWWASRLALHNSNTIQLAQSASKVGISVLPLRLRNSYAAAAARPKAHTGRAAASKTPKARKAKTAATKTKKKTSRTSKTSKAKPKSKADPRKKKKLTDKQKEVSEKKKQRQEIKELKVMALSPPKSLPNNPFGLVLQQKQHGTVAERTQAYKKMSIEEFERLRGVAKANVDANRAAFEQWVKSHTPLQIKEANAARRRLGRLLGRSIREIPDPRQVKRPKTSYLIFAQERLHSGELNHLGATERMSNIAGAWRNMTKSEQEKYQQLYQEGLKQYAQEYQSVYGTPPKRTPSKSKTS
ncbi:hypothetical protein PRK78_007098 [Emydomyces testavorans]|uniref:HMG box domain-containing protein n=1 Tax=Emydomyces testavorans TaxID=2070801 RepID=A0AAF0DN21_9EURO|nr:hypothetical protein PRK78_007098 [Emydomyces testavorans]